MVKLVKYFIDLTFRDSQNRVTRALKIEKLVLIMRVKIEFDPVAARTLSAL